MSKEVSERTLVFLVGAVQFVNILDFMMVMPLGPDFAVSLGIPASQLGLIGGSYTAAAAVSGLLGAFFLDRFDRRPALTLALVGLVLGTASGALATSLHTLVLARVVAGVFGGPATSLAMSIIADRIPAERRGRALGAVMGAFAAASVLGVPAGLELARHGGWHLPFVAVAALGAAVTALVFVMLPPMRTHLEGPAKSHPPFSHLFTQRAVLLSYAMTAMVMFGTFSLVPNLSAFTLYNLHYPRERLGALYLVGGVVSFFAMRFSGALVDRFGSTPVAAFGSLAMISVVFTGFYKAWPVPVMGIFVGFMLANAFRTVPFNAITSRVPAADERARFMSIQSAVQHMSAALGAIASSHILTEAPTHALIGMDRLALLSMVMAALVPMSMGVLEGMLPPRVKPAAATTAQKAA